MIRVYPALRGLSAVELARHSTDRQVASCDAQIKMMDNFADKNGIHVVHRIKLEAVSGVVPHARTEIAEIIQRKREVGDFSLLIVQDTDRFTRAGQIHGGMLEGLLLTNGIQVVFAAENLPDDPDLANDIKSNKYSAGRQYVKRLAYNGTRSTYIAINDGKLPHVTRPPLGVDRMYVGPEGPRYITHLLRDGRQQKLDPVTREVLHTFEPGWENHNRKQPDEFVLLVPGDKDDMATVRRMFHMKFVEGLGMQRIAKALNDDKIPSPKGGLWYDSVAYALLQNPLYTGIGIANQKEQGWFYRRGKDGPEPSSTDPTRAFQFASPKTLWRDRSEWIIQKHPALAEFLDPEMVVRACEWHESRWQAWSEKKGVSRDRHVESSFILKGLLHSTQGNYRMGGHVSGGNVNKKIRYYKINRAHDAPQTSDKMLRRLIPAESLEQNVLAIIKEVAADSEGLRERIAALLKRQVEQRDRKKGDLDSLLRERQSVEGRIVAAAESAGPLVREVLDRKNAEWEQKLASLNSQIACLKQADQAPRVEPEKHADAIVKRILEVNGAIEQLPPASLRQLLQLFISRLEVDMETKGVTIELSLPESAVADPNSKAVEMCLAPHADIGSGYETHGVLPQNRGNRLLLHRYECTYKQVVEKSCYTCHRIAA